MSLFACCFWWFVLGLLLGWLLNWLLSRWLRKDPPAPAAAFDSTSRRSQGAYTPPDETPRASSAPVDLYSSEVKSETPRVYSSGIDLPLPAAQAAAARVFTVTTDPAAAIPIDLSAARLSGFVLKHADDLTIVEGIGPKINELLLGAGVVTFAQLSRRSVDELRAILDSGGPNFKIANPGTWAQQAGLAAANRWSELRTLQDRLNAGVEPTDND